MDFPVCAGRYGLGLAVASSGLMQIVNADFVRLVVKPAWLPQPQACAVATGVVLVFVGVALAAGYRQRIAALVLVALLLVALALRIPEIVGSPGAGFVWTNPAKLVALAGGALLLKAERGAGLAWLAAGALGGFLLLCGGQHIGYAGFVDTLVPAWMPLGPRFWTLFTAGALLAGGVGVLLPRTRRSAGLLTGVMIFLWVVLLHVPRSVELRNAFELAGAFEALALAGVAWLVASRPA